MGLATSSVAAESRVHRELLFFDTSVGKKAVMAVTGVILFGFVAGHLVGNLQIFQGREKLDAYAAFLHVEPALLWTVRLILLASVILHIVASIQLTRLKQMARPVPYTRTDRSHSSYASRTMMWSGPIVAAFIVYHLLQFTFGVLQPNYQEGSVYDNVVHGFQQPIVSIAYIVAMILLCMHLYHGLFSMFQSLGVSHPSYTPRIR
ncbi:MAG: succinate dehydrogenase cytochrome b subunit, partial [Acidobacteriota bacterium]|nr:succinate dehydrogenase cytochrome b subunit [Acidobacteriota bacterium]